MAKLFVPSGAPFDDNWGETFSPTQFGLLDKLLATFFGIIWPSLTVVDVNVNEAVGRRTCVSNEHDRGWNDERFPETRPGSRSHRLPLDDSRLARSLDPDH